MLFPNTWLHFWNLQRFSASVTALKRLWILTSGSDSLYSATSLQKSSRKPENSQNTARKCKVNKSCKATGIFLSLAKLQSHFCTIYLFCSGCLIYCSGLATSWLGAGSVFSSSAGWGLGVVSCLKKGVINTFLLNFYWSNLVLWSNFRKGEAKSSYNLSWLWAQIT